MIGKWHCMILLSITCIAVNAQDVLFDNKGTEEKVKVLEINPTEVKYKRYDYLDGPVFIKSKSELFMIVFENGTKEIFGNSNNGSSVNNNHKNSNPAIAKTSIDASRKLRTGIALTATGGFLFLTGASIIYMYTIGPPIVGASIPFLISGPIILKQGIKLKREAKEKSKELSFSATAMPNELATINATAPVFIPCASFLLKF
jgi:hypothetical protein